MKELVWLYMNLQKFYIGRPFDAYECFGAHLQDRGVAFRILRNQAFSTI